MFKLIISLGLLASLLLAVDCSKPKHCKQMKNCKEAYEYLYKCGYTGLDRDGDGVPCESICGYKR
ncbi:excalibur calcium-binding domain-containing protein [Campylobacter hyointestinalis]|uniref:excalibur calcium-binding domain-containing protein n=1 Tax=Campylobacter hyointestinalis TaxID=198 RepID=UPI000CE53899|nr:excalibur calcium-binding domain-containing protein [Campylobacter hyointestinalis]PPB54646.1 cold-shock protein [Campylobacter hyointestinalis subsp. hyointestinalis]